MIPLSLVIVQAVVALRQYCLLIKVGIVFMLLMGDSWSMIIPVRGVFQSFIHIAAVGRSEKKSHRSELLRWRKD